MYRNFSLRELCGLLAWIFLMIKIRDLVKLLPAEVSDGGRGVGTYIQLVKGSLCQDRLRIPSHGWKPVLPSLSLVPLVQDDETDMSVYFIMRTLECL